MTLEERIAQLAARQHGVVTRGQLLEMGLSSSAIVRRGKSGRLRAIHAGVYLAGLVEADAAAEMAAALAGGPSATVSHTSAISLLGLLRMPAPRPVHVSVPGGGRGQRPGIRFHRTGALADDERTTVHGIPVTSPARTLVDSVGMLGSRETELALATAEREGLIDAAELARIPDRYRHRRGAAFLRALLREWTGAHLTRSEAERQCLELLCRAGLPRPHTNVVIGPYELDLFWPEERVALEIDGHRYHSSRARFEGDRRKDNWLRARGIEVIRLTWRQIMREPTATAVQVGQALALARARRAAVSHQLTVATDRDADKIS